MKRFSVTEKTNFIPLDLEYEFCKAHPRVPRASYQPSIEYICTIRAKRAEKERKRVNLNTYSAHLNLAWKN